MADKTTRSLYALLGITVVSAGTILAVGNTQGRMNVDQDAIDSFNQQVDNSVVEYYSHVCGLMNKTQDTQKVFSSAMGDTVGKNPQQTADIYQSKIHDTAQELESLRTKAQDIDDHAPRHVLRPDDGDENADFKGALKTTIDEFNKGIENLHTIHHDKRWSTYVKDKDTRIITEANKVVSDSIGNVVATSSDVMKKAPIMSEATQKFVMHTPECGMLFSYGELKDDHVTWDIVHARKIIDDGHNLWTKQSEKKTKSIQDLGEKPDPTEFHSRLSDLLTTLRDVSQNNIKKYQSWKIESTSGSDDYKAAKKMEPIVQEGARTYRDLNKWSEKKYQEVQNISPTDVESLNSFLDGFSKELKDQHIKESQYIAKVYTETPILTKATADEIQKDKKK